VLSAHGLPVVADAVARTFDEVMAAVDRLSYPLVMKRHRPGVAHKAADGGVVVGIEDREAATTAATRLLDRSVGADGAAVLVEPMVLGDELFVGVERHPDWGPLALLGVGGVEVETTGAMAFRRLPLGELDVASMLEELPSLAPLFVHGRRRAAVPSLRAMLDVLCKLLLEQPAVRSIELNPVIVQPDGRPVIVDALAEWA
jgi:succinyl-CoA synthetase beta subunit